MTATITATGVKGFLQWLKSEQPGIYTRVAPKIQTQLPQAFSDYHAGGWKTAGLSRAQINASMNKLAGFGRLGDSDSDYLSTDDMLLPVESAGDLIGTPGTVDTSTAANSGATSSGLASAIGSLVAGVSSLYMSKQQLDIQNQVVQTQLQRAAAGLPPLPTSLANLGVPQVAVGLTAGTSGLLLLGGGALILLMVLSGGKKGRA